MIFHKISLLATLQEADFALGPFTSSRWREDVADLSAPFYYDAYSVFSPRPVAGSDPTGIVKTFSLQVLSGKYHWRWKKTRRKILMR